MKEDRKDRDVIDETGRKIGETNPDPITGEPGSHPIGTGIGAAGAGAVGAAIGAVAGPVGALAGAAIGSIVGGLAGHGIAEAIDPTAEEAYWRAEHEKRPYYDKEYKYEDYAPAYRLGTETRVKQHRNPIRSFENIEGDLGREWDEYRGTSRLPWEKARHATRDAFDRTHEKIQSLETERTGGRTDAGTMGTSTYGTADIGRDTGSTRHITGTPGFFEAFSADEYRTSFASRPYYSSDARFEDYEPAYRYGHEARSRYEGRTWDDVESELARDWERIRGSSRLNWERAKLATRDAWERMAHQKR